MKNISQLRAISYAYQKQKEQKAGELMRECKQKGLNFKVYKYAENQIKECEKVLKGV